MGPVQKNQSTSVFVDIRDDTLNIDERLIEAAITTLTKAIVPVHYAGMACEMDTIMEIAHRHNLLVIEDAAQGVMATYKGRPLGSIGDLGCYSFHETKNIISGEGGALLINTPYFADRVEIIREKWTNRSQFFRGQVDKYTWVDSGSSFLPGEVVSAFLWAQLQEANSITKARLLLWEKYDQFFSQYLDMGLIRCPQIPLDCQHNAHMYYLLLNTHADRSLFISTMKQRGVNCVFHYVPLHLSPYYRKNFSDVSTLDKTENLSERLVRLPFFIDLKECQDFVFDAIDFSLVLLQHLCNVGCMIKLVDFIVNSSLA